jgi:hypothetical protein
LTPKVPPADSDTTPLRRSATNPEISRSKLDPLNDGRFCIDDDDDQTDDAYAVGWDSDKRKLLQ